MRINDQNDRPVLWHLYMKMVCNCWNWRKCMGIEPTARVRRATGFEDQGSHQTPFTSFYIFLAVPQLAQIFYAGGYARRIEMFHQRNYVFSR